MLLREFPDIDMVRRLKNEAARGADEWRNVVLNFNCREASRLNLESPYSLFLNRKGHSYCVVNGNNYRIETDTYLFSQPGDIYGLTIDNLQQTEICNIHINKRFFDGVAHTLTTDDEQLLDEPEVTREPGARLFTQLHPKDAVVNDLAHRLTLPETHASGQFETVLMQLVTHILSSGTDIQRSIARLPFARAAVRNDIYRRLALAKDHIRSNYDRAIDLEGICRETGMSKFHFLRVFRSFYGITPYQYLSAVRMEKAADLLQHTNASIAEIADGLGFEYPNSFIKAFRKTYKVAPLQYRRQ